MRMRRGQKGTAKRLITFTRDPNEFWRTVASFKEGSGVTQAHTAETLWDEENKELTSDPIRKAMNRFFLKIDSSDISKISLIFSYRFES